jgi:hypothetical protein
LTIGADHTFPYSSARVMVTEDSLFCGMGDSKPDSGAFIWQLLQGED